MRSIRWPFPKEQSSLFQWLLQANDVIDRSVIIRVAGGWVRDQLLCRIRDGSEDIDLAIESTSMMSGVEYATALADYYNNRQRNNEEMNVCRELTTSLNTPCDPTIIFENHPTVVSSHHPLSTTTISPHSSPTHVITIQTNPLKSKHLETARLKLFGIDIDICHLRSDSYSLASRIPHTNHGTPSEDAHRRDFCCNALFYNLHTQRIEDYTAETIETRQGDNRSVVVEDGGGLSDIRQHLLKCPLEPSETFWDDPLRILRAARFASQLGFQIDSSIVKAVTGEREKVQQNLDTFLKRCEEMNENSEETTKDLQTIVQKKKKKKSEEWLSFLNWLTGQEGVIDTIDDTVGSISTIRHSSTLLSPLHPLAIALLIKVTPPRRSTECLKIFSSKYPHWGIYWLFKLRLLYSVILVERHSLLSSQKRQRPNQRGSDITRDIPTIELQRKHQVRKMRELLERGREPMGVSSVESVYHAWTQVLLTLIFAKQSPLFTLKTQQIKKKSGDPPRVLPMDTESHNLIITSSCPSSSPLLPPSARILINLFALQLPFFISSLPSLPLNVLTRRVLAFSSHWLLAGNVRSKALVQLVHAWSILWPFRNLLLQQREEWITSRSLREAMADALQLTTGNVLKPFMFEQRDTRFLTLTLMGVLMPTPRDESLHSISSMVQHISSLSVQQIPSSHVDHLLLSQSWIHSLLNILQDIQETLILPLQVMTEEKGVLSGAVMIHELKLPPNKTSKALKMLQQLRIHSKWEKNHNVTTEEAKEWIKKEFQL